MSDAGAMITRCWRHQHPELYGGLEIAEVYASTLMQPRRIDEPSRPAGQVLSEETYGWQTVREEN